MMSVFLRWSNGHTKFPSTTGFFAELEVDGSWNWWILPCLVWWNCGSTWFMWNKSKSLKRSI